MDALIPFTSSGSLVSLVDKKMLVVLRDGRKLIGVLRSYDQFANLVLESAVERKFHGMQYADHEPQEPSFSDPQGMNLHLIRGENVVLLGEVDLDVEDEVPIERVPEKQIDEAVKADEARSKRTDPTRDMILRKLGFSGEKVEGDAY